MNKEVFKDKRVIIGIIAVVVVLLVVGIIMLIINNKKADAKKEAITTEEIIQDESFNGLNFTNTTFIKENGQYTLSMDVTNPSDKEIDVEEVNIVLKDKKGKEIVTLLGYIGDPMKAKETRTVTSSVSMDLSKAKSKTIEAKK